MRIREEKAKVEKGQMEERYIRTMRNNEGAKTAEELALELEERNKNTYKKALHGLKDVDIPICLDYVERIKEHLERADETIQSFARLESEEDVAKEKLFNDYGLEGDVFDKLKELKYVSDLGYLEKTYFLIALNEILRNSTTEDFILQVSRYLKNTKKGNKHYIVDKETMSNILKTDNSEEIERKIIEAEKDISKSTARIKIEEKIRNTAEEIEKYLKENGSFLADVYTNSSERFGDYYWDEERNYCYKDGKHYIQQWDEVKELDM